MVLNKNATRYIQKTEIFLVTRPPTEKLILDFGL